MLENFKDVQRRTSNNQQDFMGLYTETKARTHERDDEEFIKTAR